MGRTDRHPRRRWRFLTPWVALGLLAGGAPGSPSAFGDVRDSFGDGALVECVLPMADAGRENPHLVDPPGDALDPVRLLPGPALPPNSLAATTDLMPPAPDILFAWLALEEDTGRPQATIELESLEMPASGELFLRFSWSFELTRYYAAVRLAMLGDGAVEEFTYGRLAGPSERPLAVRDGDTTGLVIPGSPGQVIIDLPLHAMGDPPPTSVLTDLRAEAAASPLDAELAPLAFDDTGNATEVCNAETGEAPNIPAGETYTIADGARFLYTGPDPIQRDADPAIFEPERVGIIRAQATGRDGAPLTGVRVSLPEEPDVGWTESRAVGQVDLAANGGGPVTLRFEQPGFLPVERTVTLPWQDYASLPPVVLTPLDTEQTEVAFGPDAPSAMHVASGVVDSDGERQATVIVPAGTEASVLLPDGTSVEASSLTLRATEYTVGPAGEAAMPAPLPPSSGYTYAVEISADEVPDPDAHVVFSQPLSFYVENFLGFPVGEPVPTGFYDRGEHAWVPSTDGTVIAILAVEDGRAVLDLDGDGEPATPERLAEEGIDTDELERLAARYEPGDELWRVPIPHLTPWDCNWPYGPPPDAEPPDNEPPDGDDPEEDPCEEEGSSVLNCEEQSLGEDIPIAGTEFALHYRSTRVLGRTPTLRIPLTGPTIPAIDPPEDFIRVQLEIHVGGRVFTRSFAPAPNLSYDFIWDGTDAYGRVILGSVPFQVRVGFVYRPRYYAASGEFTRSFAAFGRPSGTAGGGFAVASDRARFELTSWQEWETTLGGSGNLSVFDGRRMGLGGWSITPHHLYDPTERVLYTGDGSVQRTSALIAAIETRVEPGDLSAPRGMALGPDGRLYVADTQNHRVHRVRSDGTIETVAGSGTPGFCGDGGPASDACLAAPAGVAVGPGGSLYVADTQNHRIRRVGPDGTIETVAGSGTPGFCGDGGPAASACLRAPGGLAVDAEGTLYVADTGNHRVRRVDPEGIITTLAGSATRGFCGDGDPASLACLNFPTSVALGAGGALLVADTDNARIRQVSADGVITTIAGSGVWGFCGDEGLATDACLAGPRAVTLGPDGNIYVADTWNHRIRSITPEGIISTMVGSDVRGFCGDGEPAAGACLDTPGGLAVGFGGRMHVADSANNRVRQATPPMPGFSGSDLAVPSFDGDLLYHFNASGRHLRTLDTLTGAEVHRFEYDGAGRLAAIIDVFGNRTVIERDDRGRAVAVLSPFGPRTALSVTDGGYLASITNPAGGAWRFTYASGGLLATATDPVGGVSNYTYDEAGRLTRATGADGFVRTLERTHIDRGSEVRLREPDGHETTYRVRYPAGGGMERTVSEPGVGTSRVSVGPDGVSSGTFADGTEIRVVARPDPRFGLQAPLTETTTRTPSGLTRTAALSREAVLDNPEDPLSLRTLTERFTVNGRTWEATFDAPTRTWTRRSPAGRSTTVAINEAGQMVEEQVGGRDPNRQTYDDAGRITGREWGPLSWSFAYDDAGFLAAIEEPGGTVTRFTNDAAGRTTEIETATGRRVRLGYDAASRVTGVTQPSGDTHSQGYTPAGLLASYEPPDGDADLWTWNAARQLETLRRASGREITRDYEDGFPTAITAPETTATLDYLGGRRLAAAGWEGPGGTQAGLGIAYDGPLATQVDLGFGDGGPEFTYRFDYRDDWIPASLQLGDEPSWALAPDADGLPTRFGPFTVTRDAAGQPTVFTDGPRRVETTYDTLGRPTLRRHLVGGTERLRVSYDYDDVSRLASRTETAPGGTTSTLYRYDDDGRLTEVERDGTVVERYEYDANSNRTAREIDGTREEASFDAADRILSQGSLTFDSDADGFIVRRGDLTFTYSARGELLAAAWPDGAQVTYTYDALGRMVSRTGPDGAQTRYLYGLPTVFTPTATVDSSGEVTEYFHNEDGHLFALRRGGTLYAVASDQVGSPLRVLDASGSPVKIVSYEAYGAVRSDSNPGFDLPIGFAGGIADTDTGLVRFGFRDYDPLTGRWLARDPALFDGGQANLYLYVAGDPVNLVDRLGLFIHRSGGKLCVGGSLFIWVGLTGDMCVGTGGVSFCVGAGVGAGGSVGGGVSTGSVAGNGWSCKAGGKIGPCSVEVEIGKEERRPGQQMCWGVTGSVGCGPVKGSVGYDQGQGPKVGAGLSDSMKIGAEASASCQVCASTKGYL